MPLATVLGRQGFYRITGEGEPLLLISGLGSDQMAWGYQVQAFRRRFRCIVFDNPGSTNTDLLDEPLTIGGMAEYALNLLDTLGISSAHILGTSMGGAIALELAIRHPEKIRTLSLNAAWPGPSPYLDQYLQLMLSIAESTSDDAVALNNLRHLLFLLSFTPGYLLAQPDRAARTMSAALASGQPLSGFMAQIRACLGYDAAGRMENIQAPVLLIYGEHDVLTPPEFGEVLSRMIHRSSVAVVRGAGHAAFMEKSEDFNQVHLNFWDKNVG